MLWNEGWLPPSSRCLEPDPVAGGGRSRPSQPSAGLQTSEAELKSGTGNQETDKAALCRRKTSGPGSCVGERRGNKRGKEATPVARHLALVLDWDPPYALPVGGRSEGRLGPAPGDEPAAHGGCDALRGLSEAGC